MSFDALLDRTATITHRTQTGLEDRYNVPEWEETVTSGIPYARQQRGAAEDLNERQLQQATFELFFRIDVEVDGSDVVTDEEDLVALEVIGPPKRLPYGSVPHIEVAARATNQQEGS